MHFITTTALATLFSLASGCASTGNYGPKARTISYDEASAFERSLLAKTVPGTQEPERLYTQPLNKKEPCKLSTSQNQQERSNFRAYWDGQCKNGYAYGLGRDIAISDTHHIEEITVYKDNGDNLSAPRVTYDFVNNSVQYAVGEKPYPKHTWYEEWISTQDDKYSVIYRLGITDEFGNSMLKEYTPFDTRRFFINDRQNVSYKTTDNSSMPVVDPYAPILVAEILDRKTLTTGGIALVRHGTGQVRHVKVTGNVKEDVQIPAEYFTHLSGKYTEVLNALAGAEATIERAKQVEREYLYMACNEKYKVSGLDKEVSTKICTWRNQFKNPHKVALERSQLKMEELKKMAEAANQKRTTQQDIARRQEQLDRQQSMQELQQAANSFSQFGQQMQNMGQQALQNSLSQPAPQVTPWTPSSGNQIRCINTGPVTNCRY